MVEHLTENQGVTGSSPVLPTMPNSAPSSDPVIITKSDPRGVVIEWSDGHRTHYTTSQLRGLCPCANCVNELTGARMHDPTSVSEELEHADVRMVGNYAISIRFGDGHDTGIYPFPYLRKNDPADTGGERAEGP